MIIKSVRARLLASSMILGAALCATQAYAADDEIAEIVVTGSRIPQPNLESISPVTAINADEIKAQGVTRIEDMVNSLPQAFAAQGGSISNGASGTATVNLRGLGSARTLVLIDGRRLGPGNPSSGNSGATADLNFIPSSLVKRVDVLTGGASAVYGADAIAGVVNFIMEDNFEGVKIDAQWSTYQHNQHSDGIQKIVADKAATAKDPSQFKLPKDNVRDGDGSEITLTLGMNSEDGKGNVTAYASYRQINAILQGNRDFSSCSLNSGDVFTCGGSGTSNPARVGSFIVEGHTFRPRNAATDVYNFGPTNYFQRPDERYSLGAFAHYKVSDWAEAYGQIMYMDDRSVAQIAPGGVFLQAFNINCDNPFMTGAQQTQLCGANAGVAGQNATVSVARRNVEGGGRQSDLRHSAYRYVVGLRGNVAENWTYDGYMAYTSTQSTAIQNAFFHTERIQRALLANRVGNDIQCQSRINGTDNACFPYNIFEEGKVTAAALDYLQVPSLSTANAWERVVNFTVGGDLTPYGFKSPLAEQGVGVAFGGEYRREHIDAAADFTAQAGLLSGAGGANPPINGGFDVYDGFGEIRIPIAQDQPWAKSMQLELAYRYSDYSTGVNTSTYKFGGDWEPVDGVRLRASYQRAVRAANVNELFAPTNVALDGTGDPCAGLEASSPLVTRCMQAFNLTQAQVLAIEENPASQYNGEFSGTAGLKPELSDTYSLGAVFQPGFIPGLNVTLDWFDIKVDRYISPYGADVILKQCIDTLDPFFCGKVHRDAEGSLFVSKDGYVIDHTLNTGSLRTSGVDVSASYRANLDDFGFEDMGAINLSMSGTWLDKLVTESIKGGLKTDCAGYYGSICAALGGSGIPNPEWRHKIRATWNTSLPYDFAVSAQFRYFSSVKLDATSSQPGLSGAVDATDEKLGSRTYMDLLASFKLMDRYAFRVGVNNVLDKDPPLNGSSNCPSGPCNGNTWPQVYDALGRFVFVGMSAEF